MASQTAFTLDQFLALPESESDCTHYELSEGELITLSPAGYRHGVIVMNIARIFGVSLDRKKYIISGGEAGFVLNANSASATVRGADVAVNARESIGSFSPAGFLFQPPLLAIEVVSSGNSAADLERKVNQYLAAGTQEVWLLYPDERTLQLYASDQRDPKVFTENERFKSVIGCEFEVNSFFEI